jgi:hypothetical protein
MSLDLFPPRAVIGYANFNGQRVPIEISPEFYRALRVLVARVGGSASNGTIDPISDLFAPFMQSADSLFSDIVQPIQSPVLLAESYQTVNDNSFANETTYA